MAIERKSKASSGKGERIRFSQYLESFSGPVVFFLIILAMIFVMSVFFRVSDIRVEGNTHYSDEEIIRAIDIEEGDNLFFFDRFAALSRVFAKLPYIEEVSIERSLPNKVMISVSESQALAYIVLGDEHWTIDHSCKILGKANEDELGSLIPILGMSPGTLLIGERLTAVDGDNELVDYLAEVLYQLEARGLHRDVQWIDFSNKNHVSFKYTDRFTVELGDAYETEHKFNMLVSALSQLKTGDVGTIDVSDAATCHFRPA